MKVSLSKIRYGLSGLTKRIGTIKRCPSCNAPQFEIVDRKGFHQLLRCSLCGLLYRFPYETEHEVSSFYQTAYQQPGLTTDLPDDRTLNALLKIGFKNTEKDFSRFIELLGALSVTPGARILDFGANWGYGVWQFNRAGYSAKGFELSRPRAFFSKRLGVEVTSEWSQIVASGPFDVVFSSHVLEHTPNPAEALHRMMSVLSTCGLLVAVFPSGSMAFLKKSPKIFHKRWGRVHPVLLNEVFLRTVFPWQSVAIGSVCPSDIEDISQWDQRHSWTGDLTTSEMLAVVVNESKRSGIA